MGEDHEGHVVCDGHTFLGVPYSHGHHVVVVCAVVGAHLWSCVAAVRVMDVVRTHHNVYVVVRGIFLELAEVVRVVVPLGHHGLSHSRYAPADGHDYNNHRNWFGNQRTDQIQNNFHRRCGSWPFLFVYIESKQHTI